MSARIPYPGIGHGDRVRLTGAAWPKGLAGKEFVVDDQSYHRPVIMEEVLGRGDFPWYIMEAAVGEGFSVTKVAE